jgi:membrane associated rhomboid family serine protease
MYLARFPLPRSIHSPCGNAMGIYDRDYYQEEERQRWSGGRSVVVNLILVNVAVYVADLIFENRISSALELRSDLLQRPWQCWQLLTYGFVHSPDNILHILFNMYFLWLFGSDVESIYGKGEFLRIYLTSVVVAGLAWVVFTASAIAAADDGVARMATLKGASGAVMCLMILFVLHFPRRLLYIWGVLPVPAWAIGAIYVLVDVFGVHRADDVVAHVAHLGGAAFGFIYYRAGLNLGRLIPKRLAGGSFRFKPRLRVHDPQDESRDLNQQVDRILEKISRQGEASLTKSERRTLEEASRRYQRRRQ